MNKLPSGWIETAIADISDYVQRGKSPRYTESSALPVVNQKCVRWQGIEEQYLKYVDPTQWNEWGQERFLRHGDVLWNSTGTGTIGRATLFRGLLAADRAVADSPVTIVRPNGAIISEYLHRLIQSPMVQSKIEDMQSGSTNQVELNRTEVLRTRVPLPPLSEQRRIVEKIDSLSAKSKRARDNLDHVPRLVEKYRRAILAKAFCGDLTADWRAANASKVGSEWNKRLLAEICDPLRPITYGVIKLGSEIPNGVPCLRTSNVRWLRVDTEGMKRISPKLSSEYARTILRGGEVLVNVRGTLGGVAVATPSMAGWNVSREVAVAAVDRALVEPNYIAYWIAADTSQRWLSRVEKGVAYTGVNIEDLRNLPVEFPLIDEQREIIRRIETAFTWIDRISTEATKARKLSNHLDQAVLAKAFRGELLPQDPNDEPASLLLERLRSEKPASAGSDRRKKTRNALR
jgi:type I restriction enzyme S subunit